MLRIAMIIIVVFSVSSCAPQGQVILANNGQLLRDYRLYDITPVNPEIITGADVPWITVNGNLRNKVYFNDRQTLILNEWTKTERGKDAALQHHAHELTGYVLEGNLLVNIAKPQTLAQSLGPGDVFIIPSNVHYNLLPLTARVLYLTVFTPTRDDLRKPLPPVRFDENDIKSLVHQWFSTIDKLAAADKLLPFLADKNVTMRFPRVQFKTPEDFKIWYTANLAKTKSVVNKVEQISVEIDNKNSYIVNLSVSCQATTLLNEDQIYRSRQAWVFTDQGGAFPVITYMDVTEANDTGQ
jgi:mannose-6-phosphate isomerase-like protein (cupin superfamily)